MAIDVERSTDDDVVAIPLRHPGRWIAAAAVIVVLGLLLNSLWNNENIAKEYIWQFIFDPRIIKGVWITLAVTLISMVIATILAIILAIMRMSSNPVLRGVSFLYIWFFRGTPLLVQIVFWGYLGLLYKQISLGVPLTDFHIFAVDTNTLIPAFVGGVIALSLNEAAYAAEIVRAGLLSIDHGQREAAYSLGMGPGYTLRRIVLPQSMKVIIPPMGNETISMLKNTSLLAVVAVPELYTAASQISSGNLRQVELLIVASLWYLFITSVLSVPQFYLERYYARGNSRELPPTPMQQLKRTIGRMRGRADNRRIAAQAHERAES
ncbi:MAG: amino acid ABC transporter permease [Candidatus Nanopelagicales bacterium]